MKTTQVFLATGITVALLNGALLFVLATGATIGVKPFVLGLSEGYDAAAYDHLRPGRSPRDLDLALVKAHEALAVSPYENTARLRLAYIDSLRNGRLSPKGVALFTQSYDLLPVDQNVAAWRLKFGLEHWEELTPAARRSVYEEARTFIRLGSRDVDVRAILTSIANPSGRLAAALWLRSFANTPS